MKTIAVFHPSSELYGADRILVHAINAFPKGTRTVVYLRSNGPLVQFLQIHAPHAEVQVQPGMPVIYRAIFTPLGIVRFVGQWFRFLRTLQRENTEHAFDLAYVNTLSCAFLLPLLYLLRIPRFIHVHEIIDHPRAVGIVTAALSRWFANSVVCVSAAVQKGLVKHVRGIDPFCVVVHNGIDPVNAPLRKSDGIVRFTLFGRIKPEKGQWFLLDALERIDRELLKKSHFTLMGGVVAGQEHLLAELQGRIAAGGLQASVSILGFSNDIGSVMADTDVCLVPSQMKDPFPTTVLEAMSAGRPVIATNHGGAAEAILDHATGYLISPDDASCFSDRMERYIRRPALVAEHGSAGKERFHGSFTRVSFHPRWSDFLQSEFPVQNAYHRNAIASVSTIAA